MKLARARCLWFDRGAMLRGFAGWLLLAGLTPTPLHAQEAESKATVGPSRDGTSLGRLLGRAPRADPEQAALEERLSRLERHPEQAAAQAALRHARRALRAAAVRAARGPDVGFFRLRRIAHAALCLAERQLARLDAQQSLRAAKLATNKAEQRAQAAERALAAARARLATAHAQPPASPMPGARDVGSGRP